jgi:4'-phosphopantetheinyl transferase
MARKRGTLPPDLTGEWDRIGNLVQVWTETLDRDEGVRARWESVLSLDEKARADRFHFAKDRNRFIVGRGLLRELLGKHLHQKPAGLEFSYSHYGKPALSGANSSSRLSFNLAHSAGLAVYSVAKERNLGIDVELIKPESAGEDIARRYFSTREVVDLMALPPEQRIEAFFHCWTRKEAYLKATGMGLQTPLASFSVSFAPGQPAQFLEGVEARWNLASFQPDGRYAAAVVYDGVPCPIQYFPTDSL